jgi:glycosyltransferase involved in cell wall biosynthesis
MNETPLVSIIIDNYNYAQYVRGAIDSALAQTYGATEVIVVDDGSTDGSQEIIASYDDQITFIAKENGGQASAFNAGLSRARGEIVCFLDADDLLFPEALEHAVPLFGDRLAKVHWPLKVINADGSDTGRTVPVQPLAEGNLAQYTVSEGPMCYVTPPTSGNAWSRSFLEQVQPVREGGNRHGGDAYLSTLAPLFGSIKKIDEPLGAYRLHANNFSGNLPNQKRVPRLFDLHCRWLRDQLLTRGITVNTKVWKKKYYAWEYRFKAASKQLRKMVSPEDTVILVDDQQCDQKMLRVKKTLPFLEKNGLYAGPPDGDRQAISELERMRDVGANFLVFMWPSFWWLNHYSGFHEYLVSRYSCVLQDNNLIAFDLGHPTL